MNAYDWRFLVALFIVAGSACFIVYYVFKAIQAIINSITAVFLAIGSAFVPYVPPPLRGSSKFESIHVYGSNIAEYTVSDYQKIREFKSYVVYFN